MKTIAYIMSTYRIDTYDLDIRDILKSLYHCQILWMGTKRGRPRGNHFQYNLFNLNVDDAIYEVLIMPREEITI